jgi:hypothetical protein
VPDAASALCLSCGLCCDGGLFEMVELNDDDRVRLAANGFDAPERLPHPCRHFAAPACAIYAVRPTRCAAYRCRVLEGLDEGAIEPAAAHELVNRARTLREQVADALPAGLNVQKLVQDMRTDGPEANGPERGPALARFAAYRMFVERHFVAPESHWLTRTKA